MRRSAILVSVAIVSMCLTKNTAVAAGAALRVCGPDQRVFVPLQYAYWLCAAPPMAVMFAAMGGLDEARIASSCLLMVGMVLLGAASALLQALPAAPWRLASAALYALSTWLYWHVALLSAEALRGLRSSSVDVDTQRVLRYTVPAAASLWSSFVFVELALRLGLGGISPHVEAVIWPLLETSTKVVMCIMWLIGDYSRLEHEVQLAALDVTTEKVAAFARVTVFRKFMRYLFHELRVPLNAIVLGLADCTSEVADLRAAVANAKDVLATAGNDAGAGAGAGAGDRNPLGQALAALAAAINAIEGRLSSSGQPPLPPVLVARLASAADSAAAAELATSAGAGDRAPLPQALAALASAASVASSVAAVLETVSTSAESMNKLLDDFLSLEKIEEGRVEVELVEIDVAALMNGAASAFAPLVAAKSIAPLRVEICPGVAASFVGDSNKLRQVLGNLVSNALKFSRPGGTLVLRVSAQQRLMGNAGTGRGPRCGTGVGAAGSAVSGVSGAIGTGVGPGAGRGTSGASDEDVAALLSESESEREGDVDADGPLAYEHELGSGLPLRPAGGGPPEVLRRRRSGGAEAASLPLRSWGGVSASDDAFALRQAAAASALEPAGYLRFSVLDNGPGISEAEQRLLFLPFSQIKAGARQKGGGTGLGLSICKKIVELCGGRVGVHSKEGVGSNFCESAGGLWRESHKPCPRAAPVPRKSSA